MLKSQVSNSAVCHLERVSWGPQRIMKHETIKPDQPFQSQRQTSHPPLLHEAGTNVHPASDIVPPSRTSNHKTPSVFFSSGFLVAWMQNSPCPFVYILCHKASSHISFHMKQLFEDLYNSPDFKSESLGSWPFFTQEAFILLDQCLRRKLSGNFCKVESCLIDGPS